MKVERIKVTNTEELEKGSKAMTSGKLVLGGLAIAALARLIVAGAYMGQNINMNSQKNNQPNITINQEYERPEIKEMPEEGYDSYIRGGR